MSYLGLQSNLFRIIFIVRASVARRVRLVVLGRINGLPDNVVVDLLGTLGLRYTFSPTEIRDNWNMLVRHPRQWGWLK
jgi:hypothetical protein